MNHKYFYKNYFFWIYLFLFINALVALSIHFWLKVFALKVDPDLLAFEFFAYWSMQATIMTLFYSLIKIIYLFSNSNYLQWIDNFHLKNFITFANIIAMLTYYVAVLVDPPDDQGIYQYKKIYWFITTLMHFVIPTTLIIYFCLTVKLKISFKKFFSQYGFIYLIYPIFYSIFVIIRGELMLKQFNYEYNWWKDIYPYLFFDYRQYGKDFLILAILGFALAFYLSGLLLIFINNKIRNYQLKVL